MIIKSNRKSLCETCYNAIFVKGRSELFDCREINDRMVARIQQPVTECSGYEYRYDLAHAYEAKTLGWVLEVKGRDVIGFKPPKKPGSNSDE
jgi:hypothetical protein